jgi:CBS domain containing-hemolysin-like protein
VTFGLVAAVVLILANGFFVAAEFAMVKVRSTALDLRVREGSARAVLARSMVDHLDGYLSATQLGITLSSLGLGWIGEPAVSHLLHPVLHRIGVPDTSIEAIGFAIGFSVLSMLHIVIGEVAPKSFAIARPESTTLFVAAPMRWFYLAFWPALVVLNGASNVVLRLLGVEPASSHALAVPAEELEQIAVDSAAGGQISEATGDMVAKVFRMSERSVLEIMVPRLKIQAIDLGDPPRDAVLQAFRSRHSRYPVYEGDLDGVVGVLHLRDVGAELVDREVDGLDLRAMARPVTFVPETMAAYDLLALFQKEGTHVALAVDEHGSVSGMATLEDVLEEIVGDIRDEGDEAPLTEVAGGWSVSGAYLLEDVGRLVTLPDLDQFSAVTVGGVVMELLGRMPEVGDEVSPVPGVVLRVLRMSGRAIERVAVEPVER